MDGSTVSAKGRLDIRAINKTYRVDGQTLPVLSDIDLSVHPGEFLTIVGPSGCGKSTLLRLVIGLDADYDGSILLDGNRIEGPGASAASCFKSTGSFPG